MCCVVYWTDIRICKYCYLPKYEWEEINGFTQAEIEKYQEILQSMAHLIIRFAKEGGFDNASNF